MIEYGNFYHKEDICLHPLDTGNYLGLAINKAITNEDTVAQIRIARDAVQVLYREAQDRGEAKCDIIKLGKYQIFYVVFNYNGVVYYWWERYEGTIPFLQISDIELDWNWRLYKGVEKNCVYTLEFRFRDRPVVTYVGFSSNPKQTPLMCVGDFKDISLK